MKRLSIFFAAFLFAQLTDAQNPVPNPGFETWSGGKPTGWEDSEGMKVAQPSHSGTNAAEGTKTANSYPALMVGSGGSGISSTIKYNYLYLYYKFHPVDSASLVIYVSVNDATQTTVGTGIAQITDSASAFTFLEIPIFYSGGGTPAKYSINITANGKGGNPVPALGTSFTIDDVSLSVNQVTSIGDKPLPPSMKLIMDVSSNQLEVQIGQNKNDLLEIYNVLGSRVKSMLLNEPKTLIDVSDIPKGVYIAVLKEDGYTITKKIHIIR